MNSQIQMRIMESFARDPRDVMTRPMIRRECRWFYVYTEKGSVYVKNAEHHEKSSVIKGKRKLDFSHMDAMLALYRRRQRGERVSVEATQITVNQVYWYGIFHELGL